LGGAVLKSRLHTATAQQIESWRQARTALSGMATTPELPCVE
jgi:hypothetical protein